MEESERIAERIAERVKEEAYKIIKEEFKNYKISLKGNTTFTERRFTGIINK